MDLKERLASLEARVSALEPGGEPEPAPHPLAGLQLSKDGSVWYRGDNTNQDLELWRYYTDWRFRDSTTHAPVPLWQVAKRLGVEHPVPEGVRWTDVEFVCGDNNDWPKCSRIGDRADWQSQSDALWACSPRESFRLTSQYDHQEISYGQFREILSREDKPAEPEAVLYREDVECHRPNDFPWGLLPRSSRWWSSEDVYPDWQFRNAHTQQPITREQFIQAIRNSEEREAKAKAGTLSPAEAFERANRGEWVKSGGYKWRNTADGGQYLAFGEYPGSIRECGRFERTAFEGKEWVAWNPATASEAKPAPDYRVGDLVEVVEEPCENSQWRIGERFVVAAVVRTLVPSLMDIRRTIIPAHCVSLISRPNP